MTTKKLKEGYLTKAPDLTKGTSGLKKWKTRWFILYSDGEFSYYENDKASKSLGSFNMKDCTEIFDAQAKTVHTHCLGLVTEKRTYYIAAETKDEITKWLEVLEPLVNASNPYAAHRMSISSASLKVSYNRKEGWLHKQGELNKSWKERYFVLQDGKMIYYKDSKKTDPPHGIIELTGAIAEKCSKKENGFNIITSSRTYHLVAESEGDMLLWIKELQETCKSLAGKTASLPRDRLSICSSQTGGYLEESIVDDDRVSVHSNEDSRRSPVRDRASPISMKSDISQNNFITSSYSVHNQVEQPEVSRLKEIITELRQELSVKRQEITDLKTIHAEELTSTKNTLEKQIEETKMYQANLKTKNTNLLVELDDNCKQIDFLQREIINWKNQVDEIKGSSVGGETKLKEIKKQKFELEQQLKEAKTIVASLQESEESWQEKCKQLEYDKAKIMESENSLHKTEQQQLQEINDYKRQVAELEKELLNLKQTKDQLQDSLVSCKDGSGELEKSIAEYKSSVGELQLKIDALKEDNTTLIQKHKLEQDNVKKQRDEYKRKVRELEKQLEPAPSAPKVERVLSLLSQDSTDSIAVQSTESSHTQELESLKEQHSKELANVTASYEAIVDGLKQECHEVKQELEKLALELSATPSRVEAKQFPLLTDEVMIKELRTNCESLKQQLSTVTSEKEETETKMKELEIERNLLQNQLRKTLEKLGANNGIQSKALENKLMSSKVPHVEANDDTHHQKEVSPQQPPKPKRPPKELIQQSLNQQKPHSFLHGLFGL